MIIRMPSILETQLVGNFQSKLLSLPNNKYLVQRGYAEKWCSKSIETVSFLQTQMNYAGQAQDLDAMATQDKDGKLPIHHALFANACLGAIR